MIRRNVLAVSFRARGDLPPNISRVARNRVSEMIAFYGQNIATISLETLCASCWLQGAEDGMTVALKEMPNLEPIEPLNFEI